MFIHKENSIVWNNYGRDFMLTYDEALNLNYYKLTSYTGWINGMRFLIRREVPEEGDAIFHAWVWPGPCCHPIFWSPVPPFCQPQEVQSDVLSPPRSHGQLP